MESKMVKRLSYVALGAGAASIALSGLTYLLGQKDGVSRQRGNAHFIGLWAPTFFLLAEMLDRISVEDDSYMGIPIENHLAAEVGRRTRELVGRP
jgi:hypothetical protein